MKQKRILSVQDISCFGKCSNTVALPVLSAAGIETVMLPTALLSTHTGGFTGNSFLDLTDEMRKILAHWQSADIRFDMLYTGYFGCCEQLSLVESAVDSLLVPGGMIMVDPVLGDRGKLYSIYDDAFVGAMRHFCRIAHIITPNVTEACLLADVPYEGDRYDRERMDTILDRLAVPGCTVVITGVRFGDDQIGVVCRDGKTDQCFTLGAPCSPAPMHGTGDLFASALAGYLLNGFALREALSRTVSFVSGCIRDTEDDLAAHWYGVRFEEQLAMIAGDAKNSRLRRLLEEIDDYAGTTEKE